jgi:formiminotetrahydrofolate cyclodeaminase
MPKKESLTDLPVAEFLDRLASGAPTPGGGSAAALAGALAAALASMVCEADAAAFGKVAAAYKLPRATEDERQARLAAIRRASIGAAREPLETARVCGRVLDLCSRLAEIGNPRAVTDVVVSACLARAALHGAAANVEVNLPSIKGDPLWDEARKDLNHLLDGRNAQLEVILARVSHRT